MSTPLSRDIVCALAICALTAGASGCVSVHSYVETGHDTVNASELRPRIPPMPVHLTVDFSVNGEPRTGAQNTAFNEVARTLRRSGVVVAVEDPTAASLTVSIDDQYDVSDATHNSWISGLTWGSSGSAVRDQYQFTYTLTPADGGKPTVALYQQAMITLIGSAPPPGYGQPQDMSQAFSVIVKQSVLAFLHDLDGVDAADPVMIVPDSK